VVSGLNPIPYVEPSFALQGVAGEIADVIGRLETISLIRAFEDRTSRSWRCCFYVPKRLRLDHDLVRLLGWKPARKLCAAFGGEILQTSNLNYLDVEWRRFAIFKLSLVDGYGSELIASSLSVSVSFVRKTLNGNPPEASVAYLVKFRREPGFDF
jgi:hypothetical protein